MRRWCGWQGCSLPPRHEAGAVTTRTADWFAALDATWPAARRRQYGPWTLREGLGGGQRVSAATLDSDAAPDSIDGAIAAMREIGQGPLFRIGQRPAEQALDRDLEGRGFLRRDETVILAARCDAVAGDPLPPMAAFAVFPPLHIQRLVWMEAGIGPDRLAVMDRVCQPCTTLLGRNNDRVAGTAFVACAGETAMLHALEVPSSKRRQGVGRRLMRLAAHWAMAQQARDIAVAVTLSNAAALGLYAGLGMAEVARYHYRHLPG